MDNAQNLCLALDKNDISRLTSRTQDMYQFNCCVDERQRFALFRVYRSLRKSGKSPEDFLAAQNGGRLEQFRNTSKDWLSLEQVKTLLTRNGEMESKPAWRPPVSTFDLKSVEWPELSK